MLMLISLNTQKRGRGMKKRNIILLKVKRNGPYKKFRFTILELMIVVAVVAILTTLIAPYLSRAYEVAYRFECANNLANRGQTFNAYMVETNGKMPYYNWMQNSGMREVYHCPKDDNPNILDFYDNEDNLIDDVQYSYGYNLSCSGGSVMSVDSPGNFVMSFDAGDLYSYSLDSGTGRNRNGNNGHGNNEDGVDSSNPGNSPRHGNDSDPNVDDEIRERHSYASNEDWSLDIGSITPEDTSNWYYNNLKFRHLESACHLMLDGSVKIRYTPMGGNSLLIQLQ